jgi:hypothetical protein
MRIGFVDIVSNNTKVIYCIVALLAVKTDRDTAACLYKVMLDRRLGLVVCIKEPRTRYIMAT